jgi:hypothetical protein
MNFLPRNFANLANNFLMLAMSKQFFAVLLLLPCLCFFSGCDNSNNIPTENYLRLNINGNFWEAFQINTQTTQTSSGELRISIVATSDLNETVFIIIQGFEDQLTGRTQEISSLANGDALAYRLPGTGTGTETHSSFGCSNTSGSMFIQEYNKTAGYITGTFGGTVCAQGGQDPITFSEGEFLQIKLD